MRDLVTVATFNSPTEMAVMRARLESEGIKCFARDELTVQVHNYSNSLGGVKLQVERSDVLASIQVLSKMGYEVPGNGGAPPFISRFIAWTDRIPLLNNLSTSWRFAVILASLMALLTILLTGLMRLDQHVDQPTNKWNSGYTA